MIKSPEHIIISRTDAIGDVVLTLPLALALRKKFPNCKITWFGKTYTHDVIKAAPYINGFINFDEWMKLSEAERVEYLKSLQADSIVHVFPRKEIAKAAKKAGIKSRIGTSHRIFHLLTCNQLINLGRKNSNLHEAQLNIKLLSPFGIDTPSVEELKSAGAYLIPSTAFTFDELKTEKVKVILHPRSRGSGREWGLQNFRKLIDLLPADKYNVFITGTKEEAATMIDFLNDLPSHVTNMTGKLSLSEYISFIQQCNGLVAAGTGPLHVAAALGTNALGLFPPIRPIHPGRWEPIGPKAKYLCIDKSCSDCKKDASSCKCISEITPMMVFAAIQQWK
jgi:ADP-heptose:LPS heptosyltransferase